MSTITEIPVEIRAEYEMLAASTVEIIPQQEFISRLAASRREGRPLRVKYGADPSAPDIHLGHSVPIRKLKQFQELGHQVVFIIGDYTARIGDPSGKNTARPRLTKEEVSANARTYLDQIFRILDRKRTEVVYNSKWLEPMDVSGTIELMSRYTVSQMLEREDFHKRFQAEVPIYIHEFIYPLLQGYDSVAVRADIEIGGTDQKFNLLVGRELQRDAGMQPQCILTMPLLVGLDGTHKMSKSLGNYIGVSDKPSDMFGKAMSIPDSLMPTFFELVTDASPDEVAQIKNALASGEGNPRDLKEDLARRIVALYHGADAAQREAADFRARFSLREFPEETAERAEFPLSTAANLTQLMQAFGIVKSAREAQRLCQQNAIKVVEDPEPHPLTQNPPQDKLAFARTPLVPGTYKLKFGKTRFAIITLKPD